jgi:hypothetical protein
LVRIQSCLPIGSLGKSIRPAQVTSFAGFLLPDAALPPSVDIRGSLGTISGKTGHSREEMPYATDRQSSSSTFVQYGMLKNCCTFSADASIIGVTVSVSLFIEKGKPVEKQGRKVSDLRDKSYDSGAAKV